MKRHYRQTPSANDPCARDVRERGGCVRERFRVGRESVEVESSSEGKLMPSNRLYVEYQFSSQHLDQRGTLSESQAVRTVVYVSEELEHDSAMKLKLRSRTKETIC